MFILFIPFLFLSLLLVGCEKSEQKKEEKVIKIGAILPLTGGAAEFGKYNLEATKLVIKSFQKNFDCKIELLIQDSKSLPKIGIKNYNNLMFSYNSIKIISCELSSVSKSLAPLIEADNQLLMAIAATPLLQKYKYVFRIYPTANVEAIAFEKYCLKLGKSLKNKKIVIFYINDEFGFSVAKTTEYRLNSSNISNIKLVPYGSSLREIKFLVPPYHNYDIFLIIGYGKLMGRIIKEIQVQSKKASIIIASPEANFKSVKSFLISDIFYIDIPSPPQVVSELYKSKLHREPNLVDLLIFDGLNIVLKVSYELIQNNIPINGRNLINKIRNREFNFYGRKVKVDSQGNLDYELELKKINIKE